MPSETAVTFTLSSPEATLLTEMFESELAKMAVEIRHTHSRLFREELKHRDVPWQRFEQLLASDSKGYYFNSKIRLVFRFQRVGKESQDSNSKTK